MNKQEAVEKLKTLQGDDDTEWAHGKADDVLCKLLQSLGYDDVVREYSEIQKWYA